MCPYFGGTRLPELFHASNSKSNFINNLTNLDHAYLGFPFVQGAPDITLNLNSLDVAYLGFPFCVWSNI